MTKSNDNRQLKVITFDDLKIGDFVISDVVDRPSAKTVLINLKTSNKNFSRFVMYPYSLNEFKYYDNDCWAVSQQWHQLLDIIVEPYIGTLQKCSVEDINRVFRTKIDTKTIMTLIQLL